MIEPTTFEKPRWLRDLARFLPLKSQFVLSGNVRDLQIVETAPGNFAAVPLAQAVHQELRSAGYGAALIYDLVAGFTPVGSNERELAAGRQAMEQLGLGAGDTTTPAGPTVLLEVFTRLSALDGLPTALIVDFASRLLVRARYERRRAASVRQRARAKPPGSPAPCGSQQDPAFNTIIWWWNGRVACLTGSSSTIRGCGISPLRSRTTRPAQ